MSAAISVPAAPALSSRSGSWRMGELERRYLMEALDSGFPGTARTSFVARLENAFAKRFGVPYAISFANGTATLHAALAAAGAGPGDEVIVPPLTMASTSLAVLHAGATPVFADIDPDTFNLDPARVEEAINSRTKAVIPVALYGLPPDLPAITRLAKARGLAVIEDDAQCFLGACDGKLAGTWGELASFSFQNSKHVTCGEGGMLITCDGKLAESVRRFGSLGYGLVSARPGASKIDKAALVDPGFKRHVALGYNYRLSELCAAVMLAQMERLDEFVAWRGREAAALGEAMSGCSWLAPQKTPEGYTHSWWAYTAALGEGAPSWREFYQAFIRHGGEGFYGAWSLTYLEPIFQNGMAGRYEAGLCPVAEELQPRLAQFKTNYGDAETIERQAEALADTIRHFEG